MSGFFDKIRQNKPKVNAELLQAQSIMSFERSQLDKALLKELLDSKTIAAEGPQTFFKDNLSLSNDISTSLEEELNRIDSYISIYKNLRKENFFIQVSKGTLNTKSLEIKPLILFPLIQNAIQNGYTSMEKFPIRVKMNLVGSNLKLEVSNRVNHYLEAQGKTDIITLFKSRLNIEYPNRHNFIVNSNSNLFKATLLLDIS